MTYSLTAAEYTDVLSDLGITNRNDPPIFTKAQLDRLFDRAEGDYNATVVGALLQMLADGAKFELYTVGQIDLSQQEAFDNLEKLLDRWEKKAGLSQGRLYTGTMNLHIDTTEQDVENFNNS